MAQDAFSQPDREYLYNYLDRFLPKFTDTIGEDSGLVGATDLKATSLDEATCDLARFWGTSDTAVVANEKDYRLSLSASAPAGRLRRKGHPVNYFAVCNSGDRSHGFAPKSSLAAPLLAAARNGAVVPLYYPDSVFNDGCVTQNTTTTRPKGAASSADGVWRYDVCTINSVEYDVVLSRRWADSEHNQGNIDLNHDGDFGDAGEFIRRGEVRTFAGRDYFIDIDTRRLDPSPYVKHWSDIRFTWPYHGEIKADLQPYHDALSHHVEYMAMHNNLSRNKDRTTAFAPILPCHHDQR